VSRYRGAFLLSSNIVMTPKIPLRHNLPTWISAIYCAQVVRDTLFVLLR
jgi:hypothetical protein